MAGIDGRGRVAWLNGMARRLVAAPAAAADGYDAEALFGLGLIGLLRFAAHDGAARALVLPSGLAVWARARLHARDGALVSHARDGAPAMHTRDGALALHTLVAAPAAAAARPGEATASAAGAAHHRVEPARDATTTATLATHDRAHIERTLAECGGNISRAARRLGVSRGLLYRRLRAAAS